MRKALQAIAIALLLIGPGVYANPQSQEGSETADQWVESAQWTEALEGDECRAECAEEGIDPDECQLDCNTII